MTADQLIEALGGTRPVAEALGVAPNVVHNWRTRDTVPWRRRHAVARIAAERGVALPSDFWAEDAA